MKNIRSTYSKSKSKILHSLKDKNDNEILKFIRNGVLSHHKLEDELKHSVQSNNKPDCLRAVRIRRKWFESKISKEINIPYIDIDYNNFYNQILGKNCESVVGYIPIPVGIIGPLKIDNKDYYIPMATTEGALVASTNRGCKAITESGGTNTYIIGDGMTRAPLIKTKNVKEAVDIKNWLENDTNFNIIKNAFDSTTSYGKLISIKTIIAGRNIFLKFKCSTGDAMGMNMVSKGVESSLKTLMKTFPKIDILSLSGNLCVDKKPSSINWTEGRGKSIIVEALLSNDVIKNILKCDIDRMVEVNCSKNLVGGSMAGSIGGNNAHASNIVSSIFLATGQDIAQNVTSSNCMTLIEKDNDNLHISVTMPCMEVGTVGGGTGLCSQKSALDILNLNDDNNDVGNSSKNLAGIIGSSVLAGEISLISALSRNELVSSHMKLNR